MREAQAGLIDADLGGGLLEQRVARAGQGKRGGYRALLTFGQGIGRRFFTAAPRASGTTSTRPSWGLGGRQHAACLRGERKPTGTASKLLHVVRSKGLEALR